MGDHIVLGLQFCSFSGLFWLFGGLLHFHMNFRIGLSISTKEPAGIWLGLHWIYRLRWGKNWPLNNIESLAHEQDVFLHLFRPLIFLSNIFYGFQCTGLSHFFRFIPTYFIFLDAIINGILKFSIPSHSRLVYKNTIVAVNFQSFTVSI